MATVTPTATPFALTDAQRFYQGDISNDPEFSGYWDLYGDPPDSQEWWMTPQGQLTAEATGWFGNARAGGNAMASQQAAADKDSGWGDIAKLALLAGSIYFGGTGLGLWGGAEAGVGAAATGAGLGEASLGAFYGGIGEGASVAAASAAGGAMDMFGSMNPSGVGSVFSNTGLWGAAEVAPGGAMDMFGSMNPSGTGSVFNPVNAASGGFSLSNIPSYLRSALSTLMPGESGGVPITGPYSGGGSFDWLKTAMSLGSGIYGLLQSRDLKKLSEEAMQRSDPFGPYRGASANELMRLTTDPQAITSLPGFDVGRLALERSLAAQGYNPATTKIPGNYIDAMSNYGTNFRNQELQRLMVMSGATFPPGSANAAVAGSTSAAELASKSLASIGYPLGRLGDLVLKPSNTGGLWG